jgi:hypothetical protein
VNYASIKVLVLVLATGGLIAACASGSDSPEFSSGGGGVPSGGDTLTGGGTLTGATSGGGNAGTTGSASASTSTGASTGGGTTCIPKCTADSDCQNSCPATQTGSNCCDADTGLCYVASTPMCPAPPTDGGVVMPPY